MTTEFCAPDIVTACAAEATSAPPLINASNDTDTLSLLSKRFMGAPFAKYPNGFSKPANPAIFTKHRQAVRERHKKMHFPKTDCVNISIRYRNILM
jgi:hypothetical protein